MGDAWVAAFGLIVAALIAAVAAIITPLLSRRPVEHEDLDLVHSLTTALSAAYDELAAEKADRTRALAKVHDLELRLARCLARQQAREERA